MHQQIQKTGGLLRRIQYLYRSCWVLQTWGLQDEEIDALEIWIDGRFNAINLSQRMRQISVTKAWNESSSNSSLSFLLSPHSLVHTWKYELMDVLMLSIYHREWEERFDLVSIRWKEEEREEEEGRGLILTNARDAAIFPWVPLMTMRALFFLGIPGIHNPPSLSKAVSAQRRNCFDHILSTLLVFEVFQKCSLIRSRAGKPFCFCCEGEKPALKEWK